MEKYSFVVAIGLSGCYIEDTIELEEGLSEEEVEEMYLDWRDEQLTEKEKEGMTWETITHTQRSRKIYGRQPGGSSMSITVMKSQKH